MYEPGASSAFSCSTVTMMSGGRTNKIRTRPPQVQSKSLWMLMFSVRSYHTDGVHLRVYASIVAVVEFPRTILGLLAPASPDSLACVENFVRPASLACDTGGTVSTVFQESQVLLSHNHDRARAAYLR